MISEEDFLDVKLFDEELFIIEAEASYKAAGDNLTKRGEALNLICQQLHELRNSVKQDLYIADLAKKFKLAKRVFNDRLKSLADSERELPLDNFEDFRKMDGTDDTMFKKSGFLINKNKYYFLLKEGWFKASNFTIKPLIHIYSKTDNKRLIEITNEYGFSKILEVPSKSFTSVEQFHQYVINEGNYLFYGGRIHFLKILEHIMTDFPIANELKTLGWQREGFYAFANGIFNGEWQPVNELGLTIHKKETYYSPSFSVIYSNVREDDDTYENDRYFIWQKSSIDFKKWASLFFSVYGDKSMFAIAFAISAIFRDTIYEKYKIFPHLFLFGEPQSGKSQLAWSLSNLFFNNMPAFNLNSGTQVGFFRRLSRVKNCVVWFDEYNNDIDEKRFQALKSAYDGMGHEKGMQTKDNRTEITKVNGACVISSQYLPIRDTNALLSRSIVLIFEKKKYNKEQITTYDELKKHELNGLSSIVGEILKYRKSIDVGFGMAFSGIMEQLKTEFMEDNRFFDERLLRNFSSILAPIKIILDSEDPLAFPFSYEEIYDLSKHYITELSAQINSSDAVANFWNIVEYMIDLTPPLIKEGEDFKIEDCTKKTKFTDKNGTERDFDFDTCPDTLLYIRFSKIYPLYLEAYRRQYGKTGVDMVSIQHFFKHHNAFVGTISSTRFDTSNTSAYVFRYRPLKINLKRSRLDDSLSHDHKKTNGPNIHSDETPSIQPNDDLPF